MISQLIDQEEVIYHTQEEIEYLKGNWRSDPCWDLENTEGFEHYRAELLAYRKEQKAKWEQKEMARLYARADELHCSIDLIRYIEQLEYKNERLEKSINRNIENLRALVTDLGSRIKIL